MRGNRDRILDMIEMCDLLLEHAADPGRLSDVPVIQPAALRNEVMALPIEDRAELAVEILACLGEESSESDPADLDQAWGEEMMRRSQQVASGEASTVTWEEVLARVAEYRASR